MITIEAGMAGRCVVGTIVEQVLVTTDEGHDSFDRGGGRLSDSGAGRGCRGHDADDLCRAQLAVLLAATHSLARSPGKRVVPVFTNTKNLARTLSAFQ